MKLDAAASVDRFVLDVAPRETMTGYRLRPEVAGSGPDFELPNVLLLHGYGGCKEELLGLAFSIVQACPVQVYTPDLPGHGESSGDFTMDTMSAATSTLDDELMPLVAVGHSIGARIALAMEGPSAICAISPPLHAGLEGDRRTLLRHLRQRRVRERYPFEGLTAILSSLGESPGPTRPVQLLHSVNDLATVSDAVDAWRSAAHIDAPPAVPASAHLDIVTSRRTFELVTNWVLRQILEQVQPV